MSEVTPRDREEKLLAAIAEGATGELPTPRNRKEKLLKEIYNNGGTGGGGGESTIAWRPTVDANGNISWERTVSTVKPTTQNIMGPPGENGYTPVKGTDYWTAGDKAEMQAYIDSQIGGALDGSY